MESTKKKTTHWEYGAALAQNSSDSGGEGTFTVAPVEPQQRAITHTFPSLYRHTDESGSSCCCPGGTQRLMLRALSSVWCGKGWCAVNKTFKTGEAILSALLKKAEARSSDFGNGALAV